MFLISWFLQKLCVYADLCVVKCKNEVISQEKEACSITVRNDSFVPDSITVRCIGHVCTGVAGNNTDYVFKFTKEYKGFMCKLHKHSDITSKISCAE